MGNADKVNCDVQWTTAIIMRLKMLIFYYSGRCCIQRGPMRHFTCTWFDSEYDCKANLLHIYYGRILVFRVFQVNC